jgi:Helicase associated domain
MSSPQISGDDVAGMSNAQWEPYEPVNGSDHEAAADPYPLSTLSEGGSTPVQERQEPTNEPTTPAEPKPSRLARPLPFEAWFRQLEKFVADKGHARPSKNYVDPDGYRLGRWVFRLREEERRQRLSPEERAQLESQPGWSWERKKKTPSSDAPAATSDES